MVNAASEAARCCVRLSTPPCGGGWLGSATTVTALATPVSAPRSSRCQSVPSNTVVATTPMSAALTASRTPFSVALVPSIVRSCWVPPTNSDSVPVMPRSAFASAWPSLRMNVLSASWLTRTS